MRWLLAAVVIAGCAVRPARVTHGVAAGDVSATRAHLWARCSEPATLHVAIRDGAGERRFEAEALDGADYTATVRVDDLAPATTHAYRTWCDAAEDLALDGRFRTPPLADVPAPVRLAWGGDLGGQNACRDAAEGYPILDAIRDRAPDVFVALGDMIYADDRCLARGRYGNAQVPGPAERAADLGGFWAHWAYNRADPPLQRLLASTAVVPVWDDHETVDDAGPHHDGPPSPASGRQDVHLLPPAAAAFRHWNPIDDGPLYRRLRWGRHLELFVLDTRSHRDANGAPDDPRRPKTMLGAAQRAWLERGLLASDATWKVVVSSVPMAIPTAMRAAGRDGWANGDGNTGFEHELLAILTRLHHGRVANVVWLTTDVHHATALRHRPFAGSRFELHELVTGPMHAGVFPHGDLDPTLRPVRLAVHAPPSATLESIGAARAWFNFGLLDVDALGNVRVEIVDGYGATRWSATLPRRPSVTPGRS